jgi:hypothetical protein
MQSVYDFHGDRAVAVSSAVPTAEVPGALAAVAHAYRYHSAAAVAARGDDCYRVQYSVGADGRSAALHITFVDAAAVCAGGCEDGLLVSASCGHVAVG